MGDLYAQIQADAVDFDVLATVTFQKGDSLWKYAQKYYGNPNLWPSIAVMNNISDDKSIPFGTIIYIPVKGAKRKTEIEHKSEYINETIVDLKIRLDDALAEIDKLKARIKLLEDQKTAASGLENVNQDITEEVNSLKSKNDQFTKELADKDKTIVDLQNQLDDAKAEIDKLREERDRLLDEKDKKIMKLESEIGDYKDEIQRLKQAFSTALMDNLIENGFENISVVLQDKRIIATYENRIYRSEIVAMEKIVNIVWPGLSEYEEVILIPQNEGIPLSAITITPNDRSENKEKLATEFHRRTQKRVAKKYNFLDNKKDLFNIKASFDTDKTWGETLMIRKTNSSKFKIDVVLYPQLKARFGSSGDAFESQINLAPMITITLWKGMSLSGQLIIPLQNDLDIEEDYWRPGIITANQTFRLPHTIFVSTTAGYFTEERYGLDIEAREYFANGKLFVGTRVGYTGYASYTEGVWNYSNIGFLTWLFNAGFRLPRYDLGLVAAYGKFLGGDKGIRLDMYQQFGEVDIGFFAINTDVGKDAGFNVRIPIYPRKYLPTKRFRISPAKSFQLEHLYRGFPREAIQYDTGQSIDEFMKRLNPDHVEKQTYTP